MLPVHTNDIETGKLLGSKWRFKFLEKVNSWMRIILSDKNSRNLFLFLMLNLSFAFVEMFYGMVTNSLGLISDACHMFFDCSGLFFGVVATVITKWKATDKFSYGYVRAEVLAGFVNGLALLFVAFFILSEAVERLFEPPEVKHDRLFVVSVLGFIVNLIGIYAFQHGHGHSHGGGGHGHSHGGGSHSHNNNQHSHSHNGNDHGHSHSEPSASSGNSQIMQGVFLHILADTLGSVGVIVSAILMWAFGWMIADPICSICIALLISLSVMGLVKESVFVLMQRQPRELDNQLPSCYQRLMQLEGVYSVQEPHFWTLCSDFFVGSVKLEVARNADPRYITQQAQLIFQGVGVRQIYVHLDFSLT